jgi:carboxyl-terminal processing protease
MKRRLTLNERSISCNKNALGRLSMNWDAVRKSALDHASGAEITVDTYDAIRLALRQINTHSFLQLSPELTEKEAARKKIKSPLLAKEKPSDSPESEQRRQPSPFQSRKEPEGKLHKLGSHTIASIVIPMFVGEKGELFAAKLHRILRELEAAKPCGWIVDLRGNTGGNMWPMLVGVGPILGEGDVGAFKSDSGMIEKWRYQDGEASIIGSNGPEEVAAKITGTVYRLKNAPAAAVLIDRGTASSGEAIAVAFRGRNQTRSFGVDDHQKTYKSGRR